MKLSVYPFLLALLTSCSYSLKPVYFSADEVVFTDTFSKAQIVTYQNTAGLSAPCLELVDLQVGKTTTAFIAKPTIFRKENISFLVYPNEKVYITTTAAEDYIPTFSTINKDPVRDRELLVLKRFEELEKRLVVPRLAEYDSQTILDIEAKTKAEAAPAERTAQALFDSLCSAYQVSGKFRKLTKDYIRNRYTGFQHVVYSLYRDTLLARQVYWDKLRSLLPELNALTKTSQFNSNWQAYTNSLYASLFPYSGISNMVKEGKFEACFDSIATTFSGPARDYLLSRLMYQAASQGFGVPASYKKQYRRYSMNKEYRKIIAWTTKANQNDQRDNPLLPNELLMADGKTKMRLEDVLAKHQGKYVLLDLWASWCMPCIEDVPALQALEKKYPADKFAILSVSVDASTTAWQNRLAQLRSDSLNSYLLLNKDNAALTRQFRVSTIPRYLLYDKDGRIINADAPGPREPEMTELLDRLLLK